MEINLKKNINHANLLGAAMIWLGTAASAHATVVINEIDYDQPGVDNAEFIELFNSDMNSISLDGYKLDLITGSNGNTYKSIDLLGLSIAANGYLVLCDNTMAVANCDLDIGSNGWVQNGGSDGDAIALWLGDTLVDSVAYEGIGSYLDTYAEGNSFAVADTSNSIMSIARLSNGGDTDDNASDFRTACITPGSTNISGSGDCSVSINQVPVPAAVWLFGSGLIGLAGIGRKNRV